MTEQDHTDEEPLLDPRTQRTRSALVRAVRTLVSERPVEAISITEIAKVAGVSRPTVYQQFGDVPSLIAYATKQLMEQIFLNIDETLPFKNDLAYVENVLELFVEGVYAERAFCHNAIHGASSLRIALDTMEFLNRQMSTHVIGANMPIEGDLAHEVRSAVSAGLVFMIYRWLDSDFSGENSVSRMAERLAETLFYTTGVVRA